VPAARRPPLQWPLADVPGAAPPRPAPHPHAAVAATDDRLTKAAVASRSLSRTAGRLLLTAAAR
jgi:hypothetical protein